MSSRQKGNRNELRAEKELISKGWLVQRAGYRRFQDNDFWGLWDILALKEGLPLMAVQVKSNRLPVASERKLMENFLKNYNVIEGHIWGWYDRKGWKKCVFKHNEWVCIDERNDNKESVIPCIKTTDN